MTTVGPWAASKPTQAPQAEPVVPVHPVAPGWSPVPSHVPSAAKGRSNVATK
jgi:hypothetical protein